MKSEDDMPDKAVTDKMQAILDHTQLLREQAERLAQERAALLVHDALYLSYQDKAALVHELQVHQIEFQLQNDEILRHQEKLEVSRAKYINLYNMAPVGYVTIDEQGLVSEVNQTTSNLLGYPMPKILNQPLSNFILASDQDIYYKHNKHLKIAGNSHVCELRMSTPEDMQFWARIETTKEYNTETHAFEYYSAISDISAKKKHEQILVDQNRLLQALINSREELIFSLDKEGCYTAFNSKYFEQMQYLWQKDIKIGDRMLDYMSPDAVATVRHNILRALRGERFVNIVQAPPHICFEMDWNPIYDDPGAVVGLTVFVRDITDRKQSEQIIRDNDVFLEEKIKVRTDELLVARNELEAFTASIAHDLAAALHLIDGLTHTLLEEHTEPMSVETTGMLQVIRLNALKMDGFVNSLLNVTGISRREISQSVINMKDLVSQTWDGLATENTDVSIIIPPSLPEILGDFRLIQVVWQNLLSNALKFSQSKATRVITISGIVQEECVEYCVADTGVGFDMKHSDRLFEVFTKLHAELHYAGTGIGLSVARRIVKMHGGNMWATGEIGVGAKFYFTLPVVK